MPSPFTKLLSSKSEKESKQKTNAKEQKKTKEANGKKPPSSAKSLAAPLPSVAIKPSDRKSVPKRSIPKVTVSKAPKNDKRKNSRKLSSVFDEFGSDDETEDFETADLVVETPNELPELSPEEEDLFEAVEAAQLVEVKQILMQMDVNTVSQLSSKWNVEGDTIFHVAIRRQDEAIIDFLLDFVPNLSNIYYDILLLAVKESSVEITQLILNAIQRKPGIGPIQPGKLSSLPRWQNSEFDDHMTPIMQASIVGNYDLIALFAAHGETLEPELTYRSPTGGRKLRLEPVPQKSSILDKLLCCFSNRHGHVREDISDDYQRLHEYQALASPEMICFMANTVPNFDPLLKTFEYIQELDDVRNREDEFHENYTELIDSLSEFAVQFVSMCESSKEAEMILSRPEGYHGSHDRFPRIVLAMEMGLRDFVAHPHTQAVLYTQWAGQHWNEWRYFTNAEKIWEFIRRLLFFPMFMLFVFGEQGNRHGRLLASPINRCLYACISQMIFISLAVTEHLLEAAQPNERMPPNIYIEAALAVFVAGHIRGLFRQFIYAPKTFFLTTWNWYDIINCLLFCGCFGCWGYLYLMYMGDNENFMFRKREPLERQYWKFYDPLMIADAFLALGTIMACGRLLRFVQLHSTIGPIQIALGKMIMNILNFVLFFVVVMSSFMLGLTIIYAPYRGIRNDISGETQSEVFTSHKNTLTEMYWDLFGMADASSAELVTLVVKDGADDEDHVEEYEHVITEMAGKTLYSVYSFFGATVLFSSLLVAYISNTFGQIVEENEINWKFNRAQLWVYFARSSVMPSPFNLFPTLWDIINIFRTLRHAKRHPKKYFATCNCATCFHSERRYSPEEKKEQDRIFFNLIKLLIQRYFRSKTALEARALPSAELVSSLGEEVDELKILIGEVIEKVRVQGSGGDDGGDNLKDAFKKPRLSLPAVHQHEKWNLQQPPRKSAPIIISEANTSLLKIPEPPPKEIKHATAVMGSDSRRASSPITTLSNGTQNEATAQYASNSKKSGLLTSKSVSDDMKIKRLSVPTPLGNVAADNDTEQGRSLGPLQETASDGAAASGTKQIGKNNDKTEQSNKTGAKSVQAILPPLPPLPPGVKSSETLFKPTDSSKR